MDRLDELAAKSEIIAGGAPFKQAITMAGAIYEIRRTLTDAVMNQVILPLMNSKLGFRTDKDPARPVWDKTKRALVSPEPYPVAVVRECLIEATLRGVPVVGNCFNIIASQSYITKEGFWFLIGKKVPGLTDFKLSIGVPRMIKPAGDARNASDEEAKGAIVQCFAIWKLNGVPDRVEREIPIRVNSMMGADAIMGKAERKILAAAYAQITGTMLGEGDASEVEPKMRDATPPRSQEAATEAPVEVLDPFTQPPADEPLQPWGNEDPESLAKAQAEHKQAKQAKQPDSYELPI